MSTVQKIVKLSKCLQEFSEKELIELSVNCVKPFLKIFTKVQEVANDEDATETALFGLFTEIKNSLQAKEDIEMRKRFFVYRLAKVRPIDNVKNCTSCGKKITKVAYKISCNEEELNDYCQWCGEKEIVENNRKGFVQVTLSNL